MLCYFLSQCRRCEVTVNGRKVSDDLQKNKRVELAWFSKAYYKGLFIISNDALSDNDIYMRVGLAAEIEGIYPPRSLTPSPFLLPVCVPHHFVFSLPFFLFLCFLTLFSMYFRDKSQHIDMVLYKHR